VLQERRSSQGNHLVQRYRRGFVSGDKQAARPQQEKLMRKYAVHIAWTAALAATVGSLYFSEVMLLPPCILCWYQRIAMYPLVAVLLVGIILEDARVRLYALPLLLVGLGISIYHNLLYYALIPESITPCSEGVSCTSVQIEWLGFITIPLMALTTFVIINICLLAATMRPKQENQ